ncbi:hypothetical protein [Synechococcus elongatus]|uniref:hypothetical protein n=1 Tax=Synechococcus elongatus TaxID=32046 RepID=UPI00351B16C4
MLQSVVGHSTNTAWVGHKIEGTQCGLFRHRCKDRNTAAGNFTLQFPQQDIEQALPNIVWFWQEWIDPEIPNRGVERLITGGTHKSDEGAIGQ